MFVGALLAPLGGLELRGGYVADLPVHPAEVEPVDVFERGELDLLGIAPRALPAVEEFPGCLDRDRRLGEMPLLSEAEAEDTIVYASVDPALSSGYWSVQVWATTRWNGSRYLIDGHRVQMRMSDFIGITGDSKEVGVSGKGGHVSKARSPD